MYGLRMCGKPKFGSDSVFETEQYKNLTSVPTVSRYKQYAISHSNKSDQK